MLSIETDPAVSPFRLADCASGDQRQTNSDDTAVSGGARGATGDRCPLPVHPLPTHPIASPPPDPARPARPAPSAIRSSRPRPVRQRGGRATRLAATLLYRHHHHRDAPLVSANTADSLEKFPPRLQLTLTLRTADDRYCVSPVTPSHQTVTYESAAVTEQPRSPLESDTVTESPTPRSPPGSEPLSGVAHPSSEDSRRAQLSVAHCRVISAPSLSASRARRGKRVLLIHHNGAPRVAIDARQCAAPPARVAHTALN